MRDKKKLYKTKKKKITNIREKHRAINISPSAGYIIHSISRSTSVLSVGHSFGNSVGDLSLNENAPGRRRG